MRKSAFILVGVALVLFLGLPFTADAGTTPPKIIKVDCSKGQSIQAALGDVSPQLVVEIKGVCAQYVTISRDNVTLRGVGGAVIDGTSLPTQTQHGITVLGASNVTIENLTVQWMRHGIRLEGGSAATLTSVILQNNRNGLILWYASSAKLANCIAQYNTSDGIGAWNGSDLLLSGTVNASFNGRCGIILSGSSLSLESDTTVEANDNALGIALQFVAAGFFTGQNASIATNGNRWGISAETNSSMVVGPLQCTGNLLGVAADNAYVALQAANITDNDGVDVALSFGARADFNGTTGVGSVECEPSVLTRGDVSCPESAAAASSLMQVRPQRTAPGPHGLFHPREVLERETLEPAP